jgi:hypothetical protein
MRKRIKKKRMAGSGGGKSKRAGGRSGGKSGGARGGNKAGGKGGKGR